MARLAQERACSRTESRYAPFASKLAPTRDTLDAGERATCGGNQTLRRPGHRGMAFQNLSEHVQGNHFLRPEEVAAEFENAGMETSVHLFLDDREAVVVGRRKV